MNTKFKTGLFIFFFFVSASAFAQYGYPYNNNGGGGLDRSVGRVPNAARSKDKKKPVDIVEMTVQYLDKRLNLDDFQVAAITTIYNDNKAELIAISMDKAPTDVRKDQIRKITDEIDVKVMELLSEDQVKEYQKMVSERKQ
jgi:hypothetical protein